MSPTGAAVPAVFRGRLKALYPLYRSFELWSEADGLRMSAAMSFYGILSLAPLLVLIVAGIGWWLDREMLVGSLTEQIRQLVGSRGAEVVSAALESAREPQQGILASILASGLLLMGATGVFAELQSAFERLWTQGSDLKVKDDWWHSATLRLRGVAYVLAIGFLMLVSLVISSLLGMLERWGGAYMGSQELLAVVNQAVSVVIIAALFVALMRMSAGPQPRMRHLVVGAAVGAVLFGLGKYALALYLSTAAVVSAYGAAGSLVVLLMWIYFASAVLLYSASCARVLAEQEGDFSRAAIPPAAAEAAAVNAETAQSRGTPMRTQGERAVATVTRRGQEPVGALLPSAAEFREKGSWLPEPAGVSPALGLWAALAAVGGYMVSKRFAGKYEKPAVLLPQSKVNRVPPPPPPPPPRRAAALPAVAATGARVLHAAATVRHVPAKWASWGFAAAGLVTKWRRIQAERALNTSLAAVQADVRALRRLSRKRRG